MNITLIDYTINPEKAIMRAISVCRDTEPNINDIQFCYDSRHLSVFEFATFHFEASGVSRSLTHQLVRKRIASYMQESQRFVDAENFDFVTPNTIATNPAALPAYNDMMRKISECYKTLTQLGIPKEDARYVLPNACHTKIHIQMNFRSLMEFCNERMCGKAQWEIREMAYEMKRLVNEISPLLGKFLVPKCKVNGRCFEKKPCINK